MNKYVIDVLEHQLKYLISQRDDANKDKISQLQNSISQLKDTEVIASGKVAISDGWTSVGENFLVGATTKLMKYDNQNITISVRRNYEREKISSVVDSKSP